MKSALTSLTCVLLLVTLTSAGCGTYLSRYDYTPQPGEMTVDVPDTANDPDARVLVTVVGIRQSLPDGSKGQGVDIKLRVENLGSEVVRFNPADVVVVTSSLTPLPGPLAPPASVTLAAMEDATVMLTFALPDEVYASDDTMAGLNVRVPLHVADRTVKRGIGFNRQYDEIDDHYRYYPPPYFHGYYFYHRHW